MDGPGSDVRVEAAVAWCRRSAVAAVFALAALTLSGWATGIDMLTRVYPTWPQMMPWTALWLAALGAAILAQSGHPSRRRVWMGRGLAAAVGAANPYYGQRVNAAVWRAGYRRMLDAMLASSPARQTYLSSAGPWLNAKS